MTALSDFVIGVGFVAWALATVSLKSTWAKVAAPRREFIQ